MTTVFNAGHSEMAAEDAYPQSPMQQGMLYHGLRGDQPGAYLMQMIVDMREAVDVARFRRSWQKVIDRHPVLRTAFRWGQEDEPLQLVYPQVELPLDIQDWREFSSEEQRTQFQGYFQVDRRRGFQLGQPPLMRLALFRLANDYYRCLWTFHHAILDGRSFTTVIQEVMACYEDLGQDRPWSPPAPSPYHEYIEWLQQQPAEAARRYWQDVLDGFTQSTPLPLGTRSHREEGYGEETIFLPESVTKALRAQSETHQLTLSTLVQGAWAILLSRYRRVDDIVFGVTRAGRHLPFDDAASMIGLFVSTLPVRAQISAHDSLLDFLRDLRTQSIALREFEHTSLVDVQEWSGLPAGVPLFESILVYERYQLNSALQALGGAWKQRQVQLLEQTNYPLTVAVYDGDMLQLSIAYERARYDAASVSNMLTHLATLLEAMADSGLEQAVIDLPMLSTAERHQMLVEWNDTESAFPEDRCIHEHFEAQVELTPNAVALASGDQQWTYQQLNERSNQLARYLRTHGVGPEVLVALCMEASFDTMAGLLAILKAGGAYVPLDPAYPRRWLASVLEETQAPILLTQRRWLDNLPEHDSEVICLDSEWEKIAQHRGENVVSGVSPDNLAYVTYTSGSTGRPKGVQMAHRALVNHAFAIIRSFDLRPDDRTLQFASISFDVAAEELFPSWLCGSTVVLRPGGEIIPPSMMVKLIQEDQISIVNLPASYWHDWVTTLSESKEQLPSSLRLVVVGSERVLSQKLITWRRLIGDAVAWRNAYGLTETAITSTLYEPGEAFDTYSGESVPIGRPIANTRLYILDQYQHPIPKGGVGELYIGGEGVARGYLLRPNVTAERFVPDLFGGEAGARLYRTGDLARYLPDGSVAILGRIDQQVKVRGFRIEPAEIESVLVEEPSVAEAAVVAREEEPGGNRLIAFVVPAAERVDSSELRTHLVRELPDYMVPPVFLSLNALPRLPNGKLDRKSLLESISRHDEKRPHYAPPGTALEADLIEIWENLLRVGQVGAQDNFFELGGHSLLAAQLLSRLHKVFGVEMPLRTVFEAPTVAGLAARVEATLGESPTPTPPEITPVPREGPAPLAFSQERLWFIHQMQPESAAYNLQMAMRFTGALDVSLLEQSINAIVDRHESLRTTFEGVDGRPVHTIKPSIHVSLLTVDLRAFHEQEGERQLKSLAIRHVQQPFDLVQGPLIRGVVYRLDDEEYVLLVVMHHIVSDAWSMGIFLEEMAAHYSAFVTGDRPQLPELPIQYADYAHWQREWYQGEILEKELAYWRQQLAEVPVLELPTDRPRPAVQSHHGQYLSVTPRADLFSGLKALGREEGATPFMTTLAAFKLLLFRHSGQTDIAVGVPIANDRRQLAAERLIGSLVNTIVLRTDLSGDPTFRELLRRVREVTLQAYAHQDLPFEKLVAEIQPERDLSHSPLFQVMFSYINVPDPPVDFSGLHWKAEDVGRAASHFDLTMSVLDTASLQQIELDYSSDLFDTGRMKRLLAHYQVLLEGVLADPDQPISRLPILTDKEHRRLLGEWNDTRAIYPRKATLHELFATQVKKTPNAVAVTFENEKLAYAELNRRANQLAHHLQESGVTRETLVGLCLERSVEMVIGLLAVLKAGGAYVPLDPGFPQERLSFMLADSRAAVLLTQESLVDISEFPDDIQLVCLDRDWPAIAENPSDDIDDQVEPDDLAYVIYTSGSTGRPKGVQITHQGVVNLLSAMREKPGLRPDDTFLSVTTLSFDIAVLEIFLPLITGARLMLVNHETAMNGTSLKEALIDSGATIMQATPTTWRMLLESNWQGDDALKVLCGGEAWSLELAHELLKRTGSLWNMYGPTETTVWSAVAQVQTDDPQVFIGSPIANTQFYVLDSYMQPVPIGVPGELYISGEGLARGYWDQAALTAAQFVPNPFSDQPGERMYKTGDLVRYIPDGRLEFLGRLDDQVKIRGYRIELGEIEATLRRHPAVREAVARTYEYGPTDVRLAAYLMPAVGRERLDIDELRYFVRQSLPDYMVPSVYLPVEEFPLTPNQKIDRQALPKPDETRTGRGERTAAPGSEVETVVATIMADLLRVDRLGVYDNFFDLGGHSLLAAQLLARLQKALGVEISLRHLFESPSVDGLVAAMFEDSTQRQTIEKRARIVASLLQLPEDEASALLQHKREDA